MPCSYWAYIDASSLLARIRVEATCSLYGSPVEWLYGHWLVEPRGGKVRLEYTVPAESVAGLAETPCTPLVLPQPWPPYSRINAELVFDTRPGLLIYGLPARKSTVITTTERTLLEGSSAVLQAVAVEEGDVVSEEEAYVDNWLVVASLPPLRSRLPLLEEARACEVAHGGGLEDWGRCLWERGRGYRENLLEGAPAGGWPRACLYGRLYAGSLVEAGVDPLMWLRRVRSEHGPWPPLRREGRLVRVNAPRARVVLARREESALLLREENLEEGAHWLGGWEAAGLICRNCLERL